MTYSFSPGPLGYSFRCRCWLCSYNPSKLISLVLASAYGSFSLAYIEPKPSLLMFKNLLSVDGGGGKGKTFLSFLALGSASPSGTLLSFISLPFITLSDFIDHCIYWRDS